MDTRVDSFIRRAVPLVGLLLFPLAALRARFSPVDDPDAPWHVLAGRHVLSTGSFAGPDPFDTFTTTPWVMHEWLPEVALSVGYRLGGWGGYAWLAFLLVLTLLGVLWVVSRERAGLLAATGAATIGWIGCSGSLGPRPQLVSFLLLAVTAYAWRRTVVDGKPRWWLIPLTWFWACCHGMWFLSPMVGGASVLAIAATRRRLGEAVRLMAVPVLGTLAASLLTPVGPTLVTHSLTISGKAWFVSEWNTPSLRDTYVLATAAMLLVVLMAWIVRRSRPGPLDLVMWLLAAFWTVMYARTVAVGAILVTPLFAAVCQDLIGPREPRQRTEGKALALGLVGSAVIAAALAPGIGARSGGLPKALLPELRRLPAGTVVFNGYSAGGWLLLEAPHLKPVVDPRTDMYTNAHLRRIALAYGVHPGWQGVVADSGARAALLETGSDLQRALVHDLHWHVVAQADGVDLLRTP